MEQVQQLCRRRILLLLLPGTLELPSPNQAVSTQQHPLSQQFVDLPPRSAFPSLVHEEVYGVQYSMHSLHSVFDGGSRRGGLSRFVDVQPPPHYEF